MKRTFLAMLVVFSTLLLAFVPMLSRSRPQAIAAEEGRDENINPAAQPLPLESQTVSNRRLPPPNVVPTNNSRLVPDSPDAALDREAKQLALRVRAAKEPEKSKLRAELEQLTERHFESRLRSRKKEIDELADRIDKLRVAQHRRQENKPDILKRRLADLLDEENELKWDEPIRPSLLQPIRTVLNAAVRAQPQSTVNIDGEWLVTLPAGFEFVGTIEKQPEGCWSFKEMRNLSGYYQIEGNVLKAVITDKKNPQEFEWLILNKDVMVLTKSPQNIGADYRGATLRRGAKPGKKSELEPQSKQPQQPDVKNANDPNDVSSAFRQRQAKIRLAAATATLARLFETNKKVPGTVPEPEIAKAKLNVELLEIELEALRSGVDLARPNPTERPRE